MIARVGEQTGGLDEMLSKIADFYDEEVDAAVSALLSLMEPIMIVVLGVIVGGMVVAMYLPIFDMVNAGTGPTSPRKKTGAPCWTKQHSRVGGPSRFGRPRSRPCSCILRGPRQYSSCYQTVLRMILSHRRDLERAGSA